jgi:hypothetical protein
MRSGSIHARADVEHGLQASRLLVEELLGRRPDQCIVGLGAPGSQMAISAPGSASCKPLSQGSGRVSSQQNKTFMDAKPNALPCLLQTRMANGPLSKEASCALPVLISSLKVTEFMDGPAQAALFVKQFNPGRIRRPPRCAAAPRLR